MRIAISDDDRDQHRVLRIRVVWEKPSVGYAEFFGALLKDYGFDAEECRAATVEGLQRLCSTRSEKQLNGTHAELVADLWDDVQRKKMRCHGRCCCGSEGHESHDGALPRAAVPV